jgi:hypothetical protein
MRTKQDADFIRDYEGEFAAAWDAYRIQPLPFAPRAPWVERVAVASMGDGVAVIKRMDEDGEIYTAEVPLSDLDDFGDN